MSRSDNIICGLDVGTTKICAIIGELNADGVVDIIGVGTSPSRGLRRGVVVNIDLTVSSIKKAVDDAELMAGRRVETVLAGISGGHIKGINSHGVIAIKNREVTTQEVSRVIDAARAVAIPLDREVIHILPQEFMVDDQGGIRETGRHGRCSPRSQGSYHNWSCFCGSKHREMRSPQRSDSG